MDKVLAGPFRVADLSDGGQDRAVAGRQDVCIGVELATFLFWMPDSFPYRHWLRVDRDMPGQDEPVFRQFGKMTVEDSLVVPYFRESGMKYFLFENGNDSLRPMVERNVAKEKRVFMR